MDFVVYAFFGISAFDKRELIRFRIMGVIGAGIPQSVQACTATPGCYATLEKVS